jgi:hypothetical protein
MIPSIFILAGNKQLFGMSFGDVVNPRKDLPEFFPLLQRLA